MQRCSLKPVSYTHLGGVHCDAGRAVREDDQQHGRGQEPRRIPDGTDVRGALQHGGHGGLHRVRALYGRTLHAVAGGDPAAADRVLYLGGARPGRG